MPMTFSQRDSSLTAAVSGEVDHHQARRLMVALEEEIALKRPRQLTLDLGGVTFMDSSGIALVLKGWKKMKATGGKMTVRNTPEQPKKVLRAAGLDKLIPM